jgi:hypothetical protein
MLATQFYGTDASGFYGAGFGAIASTAATTSLQNYLKSIGRYSGTVTGVMNDATMAAIFDLFIATAATVGKIPLLPSDVRDGINKVVGALKDADNKIKSITFGQVGLSSVIKNWTNIQAAVRLISSSAADAVLSARDAVYNAVASQAGIIEKALRIFFPPAQPQPGATTTSTGVKTSILAPIVGQFLTPGGAAATTPGGPGKYPAGSIARFNVKRNLWSIYVPIGAKVGGGLGLGIFGDGDCLYGNCHGLGADEPPPGTVKGGEEVQPVDPKSGQAIPQDPKKEGVPFYKKPLFWAAVGGGVLVIGGGTTFMLMRRRKKTAAASAPVKAA